MIEQTPPHEPATESCFLDAVMMSPLEQAERLCANLEPDDFYASDHQDIFRTIQAFLERGEAPIFSSVAEECPAAFQLVGSSVSNAHAGDYRARLLRASRKRFLRTKLLLALEALSDANLERPVALVEEIAHAFGERFVDEGSNFARPIGDQRDEFGALLEKVRSGEQGIAGRSTGYQRLDQLVAGLQRGRLYTVAARTGAGKTTFVCNLAHQMAKQGTHCAFFSLEMGAQEIFQKLVAIESGVDLFRLRQGQVDPMGLQRATDGAASVSTLPIFVNDGNQLGLSLVERDCARLKQANQLDLIIVDYLQLMWTPPSRKQRYEAVGELSRGLKALARKLDVPVVACAQLSRKADEGDGEPQLHHLRESGSIEQDSDSVWMLWRDGMKTHFKVAKQRNGPTGRLAFNFDQERERFTEDNGSTW